MLKQLTNLKIMLVLALMAMLTACGEQLIKPADKHIEAMVEFDMPDFDANKSNVIKKVEKWLVESLDKDNGKTQYVSSSSDAANGRGFVTFNTRGDDLTVRFNVEITAVKANLIRFRTYDYVDEPGPRQGDSDRTYIFYNVVKNKVLGLADELEDYMNEDTRVESILDATAG